MWLKNARLYTIELSNELKSIFNHESSLEELIQKEAFTNVKQMELSSFGFSPLFGRNSTAYTFSFEHNHFLRFTEENKLLPSSIINQALKDSIEQKEEELQRSLKKNEKAALKTAITNQLLARAFATRRSFLIWINSQLGFIAVATTSSKRAENAISYIRKALGGSFPAKLFSPHCVVEDRLSNYLKGNLPALFTLGNDAVLKSNDDTNSTIRISKDDLTTQEVLNHLNTGKMVTEIQLNFDQCVSFILTHDFTLKRLSIDDQYLGKNLPQKSEDILADSQSALIVQGDLLARLVSSIYQNFDCQPK